MAHMGGVVVPPIVRRPLRAYACQNFSKNLQATEPEFFDSGSIFSKISY